MTPARLRASMKFLNTKSEQHMADMLEMHLNSIHNYLTGTQLMPKQVEKHIMALEKLYHINNLLAKLAAMIEDFNASKTNVEAEEKLNKIRTALKIATEYSTNLFPPKIYRPRGKPFSKKS